MQGVLAWLFHRRDIDGLIVGLLLYTALSKLLLDVNEGVFKPANAMSSGRMSRLTSRASSRA